MGYIMKGRRVCCDSSLSSMCTHSSSGLTGDVNLSYSAWEQCCASVLREHACDAGG
jgi:hypothetical protein